MFNKLLKRSTTKLNLKNKNNKKEDKETKKRNEYLKSINNDKKQNGEIKRSESFYKLKRTSSNIGSVIYKSIDNISTPTNIMFCRSTSSYNIISDNNINTDVDEDDYDYDYNDNDIISNHNSSSHDIKNTKEFEKIKNSIYVSKMFNFYLL
ncbi:hypothetical protein DICPUDRAFT_82013 [Dictyostelium purpureum]|uniref:Uncharacterized protein n=1 Tax=Dictyostelium purpureum TaxID=5786 RepID=F0ZV96_DICPU|nr:uncharacterized protein DICPUDRAFT_82013 [Dictyostelium purpureum]EGC32128.1 hypothetical protein DICPUDRAFT_82013 [Dictyostelium purpureum]|eukprot:XP_003291337.1 hypothetical protein DICPUDRAFT_82013 [Dictyostelium purpureum]